MCKMIRIVFVISLLLLSLGAGSCSRMQARSRCADLLSTGLIGWQQIGGEEGAWHFEPSASLRPGEGVLYTEGEGGGWLATRRSYGNFALSLEFRIAPGGNSGVFIRSPLEGNPAYQGMEIQIVDDCVDRSLDLQPYQYTGSIYGVQAPSDRSSKRAGQWQQMVIVASGPKISVTLNGKEVIGTDVNYYRYKFDTHPGLMRKEGYIGLQNHGSRVEFRHIRIQELPDV